MSLVAVAFRVTSDRIRDTEVKPGTTIGEFVGLLSSARFDVAQAHIRVIRRQEDDVLVGRVENYVLKDGDAIELITNEIDMPVLKRRAEAMLNAKDKAEGKPACNCGCSAKVDVTSESIDDDTVIHITVHKG